MPVFVLVLMLSGLAVLCIVAESTLAVWESLASARARRRKRDQRPEQTLRFPVPHLAAIYHDATFGGKGATTWPTRPVGRSPDDAHHGRRGQPASQHPFVGK